MIIAATYNIIYVLMKIISIAVDFPSYWLKSNFYFNKHIIEAVNGSGKSTCFNIIVSMFTNKLWNSPIPAWSASVKYLDWTESRLVDGIWYHPQWLIDIKSNPILQLDATLAKFIKVGDFFKWMSTPEQRQEITKLLNIDEQKYIDAIIPGYYSNYSRDLRAEIKLIEWQESILLKDIEKHQYEVIQFENTYGKHFVLPEEPNQSDIVTELLERYNNECNAVIASRYEIAIRNEKRQDLIDLHNTLNDSIALFDQQLSALRQEYLDVVKTDWHCQTCWSPISHTIRKEQIAAKANDLKSKRQQLLEKLENMDPIPEKEEAPNLMPSKTLKEICEYYGKPYEFVSSTSSLDTMKEKISHYHFHKDLLEKKSRQLIDLDADGKRETLDKVLEAKKQYTEYLQQTLSSMPHVSWVAIELFKQKKNGTQEETFVVTLDGVPMSQLSNGQSLYCQFAIAHMFAKVLGIPFILFDEAGTLSEETYQRIITNSQCQVLFARATPFIV